VPNREQLEASVQVWQLELDVADRRAARLRSLIEAAKEILKPEDDEPIPVHVEPIFRPPAPAPIRRITPGKRPSVREAAVTHMRENHNRGWLTTELADELWQRKWLGGVKKPSKSTLRQALENLQEQGVVVGEKQGEGQWAPTRWTLSDKMLSKPADLS
jgi:hypothetical protein